MSVSPLAKGLFQRAILQSGECVNNNWYHGIPNDNVAYASNLVDTLLNVTGAGSLDDLKNSTEYPAMEFSLTSPMAGWPFVALDREILPEHPRMLYEDPANIVPTDFIVGSNSYEDAMFMAMLPEEYVALASGGLADLAKGLLGTETSAVQAYDPSRYDESTTRAYAQFNGDYYIRCPSRAFASIVSRAGATVYLYNFAHFGITDPVVHFGLADLLADTTGWASHLAELPYVFGTLPLWVPATASVDALTDQDYAMSQEMQTRWANFAKSGKPDAEDGTLSEWEPFVYNSSPPVTMVFAEGQGQMQPLSDKIEQCSIFSFAVNFMEIETPEPTEAPTPEHDEPTLAPSSGVGALLYNKVSIVFLMVGVMHL